MDRILWVNPSFLDYRIPLYGKLNHKLNNAFHLLYSKERIPERCHKKINEVLGCNAHYLEREKRIRFGKADAEFANTSISIPIPRGLYGMIKNVRPSAIIAEGFFQFTPWALAYSIVKGIPLYIAYERTAHTERNCPWWRKCYRKLVGLFVKGYIANGTLTKEYLISQGVKPDKIFTGGMCADSSNLRENTRHMSEQEKEDFSRSIMLPVTTGIRYIYVGQLIERKGVNHLIAAWKHHSKKYPDDQLLIVGDGEFSSAYKNDSKDCSSIYFTGSIDYSLIYKYYAISDVFIIPTLEDNWSLVVPEAMACNLPIACSIYNGCHPELVKKDINGTTFDPLNPLSIISALEYFQDKDLIKFGNNSSSIEEEFSPSKTADKIIQMLLSE